MVSIERQISNLKAGRHRRTGQSRNEEWKDHLVGACGELAAAKALHLYPSGMMAQNPEYTGDLFPNIEVRATIHQHGHLVLKPADSPERPFVLVCGIAPYVTIAGWIIGADGMHIKYWRGEDVVNPAYFVPQSDLHPITELMWTP